MKRLFIIWVTASLLVVALTVTVSERLSHANLILGSSSSPPPVGTAWDPAHASGSVTISTTNRTNDTATVNASGSAWVSVWGLNEIAHKSTDSNPKYYLEYLVA